jgi:hypothetical protein
MYLCTLVLPVILALCYHGTLSCRPHRQPFLFQYRPILLSKQPHCFWHPDLFICYSATFLLEPHFLCHQQHNLLLTVPLSIICLLLFNLHYYSSTTATTTSQLLHASSSALSQAFYINIQIQAIILIFIGRCNPRDIVYLAAYLGHLGLVYYLFPFFLQF